MDDGEKQLLAEIARLEREIEEVRRSLPKHSVQASHWMRLEELEAQLEAAREALLRLRSAGS